MYSKVSLRLQRTFSLVAHRCRVGMSLLSALIPSFLTGSSTSFLSGSLTAHIRSPCTIDAHCIKPVVNRPQASPGSRVAYPRHSAGRLEPTEPTWLGCFISSRGTNLTVKVEPRRTKTVLTPARASTGPGLFVPNYEMHLHQ